MAQLTNMVPIVLCGCNHSPCLNPDDGLTNFSKKRPPDGNFVSL